MRSLPHLLTFCLLSAAWLASGSLSAPVLAAELTLHLPLGRTAYQTNELIDVAVVRNSNAPLSAGRLALQLRSDDGSSMSFAFPVKASNPVDGKAQAVEHLRLNGWLLRPGNYSVSVESDGAKAETRFRVYSHVRRSSYRLIHWGGAKNDMMTIEGEDGLGFNMAWGETGETSIVSGQDVMGTCLMGGGHQHDLKNTNDWSDPNVYIGAIQRGVDRAFGFRTMPNAIGAHLHDEPGLTWLPHPYLKDKDGKPLFGPHDIGVQRAAYRRAFGEEMPFLDQADTKSPEGLAKWERLNDFKLGFMDAFWKTSRHALEKMKPGYLPVTQSHYGWMALYDGYYFNVARSLPVISGHGGYSHYWLFNLNPSFYVEISLPRQLDKPTWYLPEWGTTDLDGLRQIQNLAFITGIQGVAQWPGINIDSPHVGAIAETNKIYTRLGTIFTKPQATRQPVSILYSKSNAYFNKDHTQVQDLSILYVATRLTQYPVNFVLDEDVVDGTMAAEHKAIIVSGITYLDPAVIDGLADFVARGGTVITTADTTVNIPGATRIDVVPDALVKAAQTQLAGLTDAAQRKALDERIQSYRGYLEFAEPTAKALQSVLASKGIAPAFTSDLATVAPGRQVRGEIEYLFAVNVTPRAGYAGFGTPVPASANLGFVDDGRPVYNALSGMPLPLVKNGQQLTLAANLGPGQMLAIARPARPVGGVLVSTPAVNRDLTRENESPIRIEFSATLVDSNHRTIAGSAPLRITLTDPLGAIRYDLYRATEQGVCNLSLPLAANDAAGTWTVRVQELLSHTASETTFSYQPASQCGALAGASQRAAYYEHDRENVFRFFRSHRQISIVAGSSDYAQAAAERLAAAMKPYNVEAKIVPLNEANQARPLTDEEAKTWCGTTAAGDLDENARKNPHLVGYNLTRPTVLIGNPQDHPLIKRLHDTKVLPYTPTADFPGRGRGMIAWNLMTLGHDVEALACIANDAEGMNDAVGTLFTLATGIDPVTPRALPLSSRVTSATQRTAKAPIAKSLWHVVTPDRVVGLNIAKQGVIEATSINGTQTTVDASGKVLQRTQLNALPASNKITADTGTLPKEQLRTEFRIKQVATGNDLIAVTYWGGRLQIFEKSGSLKTEQQLDHDVTAMTWIGQELAVGLSDGAITLLRP